MSQLQTWEEFAVVRSQAPAIFQWGGYEPSIKYHASSTALVLEEKEEKRIVFIDPLPLAPAALAEMISFAGASPEAIFLTSANHQRASLALAKFFSIPIYAPQAAREELVADYWFAPRENILGVEVVDLNGFALAESAFWYCQQKVELLVVGDAIIHGEGEEGLFLLPKKYCLNFSQAKKSLRSLKELLACLENRSHQGYLDLVCFAHGLPLTTHVAERLRMVIAD